MNPVFEMSSPERDVSGANPLAAVAQFPNARCGHQSGVDAPLELLRTISEVLDIRQVFPRVSEIAKQMLPHDHLHLTFIDPATGQAISQAGSTDGFPEFCRVALRGQDELRIVGDLRKERVRAARIHECDLHERIVEAGYRSLLAVPSVARRQPMRLEFFAKRPHAFSGDDVPTARRLADYIAVSVSHEQLADAERRAVEARVRAEGLEARVHALADAVNRKSGRGRVIGQSGEWRDVLRKATQVASTEATAFLQGESGTGKEVVARFIHRASPRKDGPFVAINCAALPEPLLESELFGFERGAFTGAHQSKPGQIELASAGVLFLDEVSEMSPAAQSKFLRVLQEREFLRLGGTRLLKTNARVIAATNRDLRDAVERGAFREDLYYRLQVFDIRIPPLRERRSDIPLLVDAFIEELGGSMGRSPAGLAEEAMGLLLAYRWPGNVRELHNVLERAAILSNGGQITPQHLALPSGGATPASPTDLRAAERRTIEQVLRETGWNKAKAARRLGLTRTQLYVRLRKYDLGKQAVA